MLLPVVCPVCGRRGRAPCAACASALRPAPPLPPPSGVDACLALLAYEGAARPVVTGLKYRHQRAALAGLAAAMASLLDVAVDAVTWAPTAPRRRRHRGYDQAELLARAVADVLELPCVHLLRRARAGATSTAQTGRPAAERWAGPAFVPRRRSPAAVAVVDDVITTGATMAAAARALRAGGATTVVALAAARTPAPGTRERREH